MLGRSRCLHPPISEDDQTLPGEPGAGSQEQACLDEGRSLLGSQVMHEGDTSVWYTWRSRQARLVSSTWSGPSLTWSGRSTIRDLNSGEREL